MATVKPEDVAENTNKYLLPAVIEIFNPVSDPVKIVPTFISPDNEGAKLTSVPGTCVKLLLPAGAVYKLAFTVAEPNIRLRDAVILN